MGLMQKLSRVAPMNLRRSSRRTSENEDDAESMETLANRMGLIAPDGKRKVKWDWFVLVLVLYTGLIVPFTLSFKEITDPDVFLPGFILDTMINVCYIVDIFISWRTTYYDRDGMLVLDKKLARRNYIKTWFWIDVIASFPFDYFIKICTIGSDFNVPASLKLPAVLKLLRIFRLGKKIDRLSSSKMFRIGQFTFMLIFAAHWFACLWFWQGGEAEPGLNGTMISQPGATGTSWVYRYDIADETTSMKYLASLYWAITTLMKSPWFHPTSPGEFISALLMIIFGCVLFAYFIGNVTAVITAANASGGKYRAQVGELKGFCAAHQVSAKMTAKLLIYQDALWTETSGGLNRAEIVNKYVPTHLLPQVTIEMFKPLLTASPFLFDISASCCVGFLRALKICICDRGDVLMKAGSLRRTMYVLMKGEMKIQYEKDAEKETIEFYAPGARTGGPKKKDLSKRKSHMDSVRGRTDKMGTLIGFQDVFKKMEPLMYTATATVRTSLLSITRGQLKDLLTTYADDKDLFEKAIEFANTSIENTTGGRRSASDGMKKAGTAVKATVAMSGGDKKSGGEDMPGTPETPKKGSALESIEKEAKAIEEKEKKDLAEKTPVGGPAPGAVVGGVSTEEVADLRRKIETLTKIASEQFQMIEHQNTLLAKLLNKEGDDVVPFPGTPRGTSVSDTDPSPHPPKRRSSCKSDDSTTSGDVAATTAILMG